MDLMGNNRTNSGLGYAAVNPESFHWIFFFFCICNSADFGAEMIILFLDQEQHRVSAVYRSKRVLMRT